MRWVIKNPAPVGARGPKWGDFHFGRSLCKYLERRGHEVVTHYHPEWVSDDRADVVLVLRGRYPFPPDQSPPGALRVMWNISHPADVAIDEYATYDLVCVASRLLAQQLDARLDRPVHPLLQCTDVEEFHPTAGSSDSRTDIVFIGNTRDVERPGVLWAVEYGLPLKIWGRGWTAFQLPPGHVVGAYFPNEQLASLYASARATLNDHWDDMKQFGFVNNRILDALACGLPVVSDWHPELEALLPRGVLMYRDREEFDECVEVLLLEHPRLEREVAGLAPEIHRSYSFENRTAELCGVVEAMLQR